MLDFNRTEASSAPLSVTIDTFIARGMPAEERRGYLGASAVGHACLRRVQYDWMCDPVNEGRLRDIFTRGHLFEALTRGHFKRAGFQFADEARLTFEALGGEFRGHADEILIGGPQLPGVRYPALWEHKCLGNKGWRALDRDGLERTYPQYLAQCLIYMHYLGVAEHAAVFTAINADSCARLHLLVDYDADKAAACIARAQTVIDATRRGELLPRFTDDAGHYRCRLCSHAQRCWR